MSEKLSQAQIDILLNKMTTGEVVAEEAPSKVREYDFRSPRKFTKEQLKALDGLHETLSRVLTSYFSSVLRIPCEIEVTQAEEERFYEYANALAENALLGLIKIKPEEQKYDEATFIIDVSTAMGFYLVDRLLGGSGKFATPSRDFTEIEMAILSNVFEKISMRFQDIWNKTLELTASLAAIETNSRLLQAYAPEDIIVISVMNVKIGDLTHAISICIPAEFLEQVVDRFSLRFAKNTKRQPPAWEAEKKRMVLENVCESELEMKVVFDQLEMTLRDILQLQPMDVIPLTKSVTSDVSVLVDEVPWFTAKLGETKRRKAIRLSHIVEQTEMITNGN